MDAQTLRKVLLLAVIGLGVLIIGVREVAERVERHNNRPATFRGRFVYDGGAVGGVKFVIRGWYETASDAGTFEEKISRYGQREAEIRVWGSAAPAGFPLREWRLGRDKLSVPIEGGQVVDLGDIPLELVPSLPPGKIGLLFNFDGGTPFVEYVPENTPAFFAGIQEDDVVLEVDGVPVSNVDEAMSRIPGEPGTHVLIKLRRGEQVLLLDIVRMAS